MDMDADEQATPLVLAKNVKSFVVECWDTNALAWDTEWDNTNSLPTMVRVTLTLGGNTTSKSSTANTLAITREIAVPSETLPSVVQNGSLNALPVAVVAVVAEIIRVGTVMGKNLIQ